MKKRTARNWYWRLAALVKQLLYEHNNPGSQAFKPQIVANIPPLNTAHKKIHKRISHHPIPTAPNRRSHASRADLLSAAHMSGSKPDLQCDHD